MNENLYSDLLEKAIAIQSNTELGLCKDERDYAFTFIYPPSQALYELNESPYDYEKICSANLYIHIPYCTGRCSYCYFGCYSLSSAPASKSIYIENLCKEMMMISEKWGRIEALSIHFGGGTPSILNEQEIDRIFSCLQKCFYVKEGTEITFESSPETLTMGKLQKLLDCGVNRLNIGIQTLNDNLLHRINRRHDSKQALNAILLAQQSGLKNINVDLMYGIHGQNMEDWKDTLYRILDLGLQSISTYRLRIHPNGKIQNQLSVFSEYDTIKMYIAMLEIMDDNSYYQCSSHKFAKKKEFSQKQIINKRGIKNNNLIPIGMAAYGYINNILFWNERTMENYNRRIEAGKLPYSIGYQLDNIETMAKSCVLGIHNVDGIDLVDYKEMFEEDIFKKYGELIFMLQKHNLLDLNQERLKLSKLGMVFADEIATQFYSSEIKRKLKHFGKKYGLFFEQILE